MVVGDGQFYQGFEGYCVLSVGQNSSIAIAGSRFGEAGVYRGGRGALHQQLGPRLQAGVPRTLVLNLKFQIVENIVISPKCWATVNASAINMLSRNLIMTALAPATCNLSI